MLLALDVGNTEITIGVFDGDKLVQHWRAATVAERTADEHALLLGGFLAQEGMDLATTVSGVTIASVVPRLSQAMREMVRRYCGFEPLMLEPGIRTGLSILTDNPREVGTATTFDAVSRRGEMLGVAIAPGIEISTNALVRETAQLRRVELVAPRSVIGKNTAEALQAGIVFGFAGQLDALVRRMIAELGDHATVIATGGLAAVMVRVCETIDRHDPWLTLHGLRIIFDRNDGRGSRHDPAGGRPEP